MNVGREPVLTAVGLLAPAVQLLVAFFVHDAGVQTATNVVAAALAGVISAVLLKSEKLAPAILGFAQAFLAWGITLGWDLSAERQAAVMAFVGVLVASYVRTQVFAKVPATISTKTEPLL
jgi:hypothetical protein